MTELLVGTRKGLFVLRGIVAAGHSRSPRAPSRARWWSSPCAIPAAASTSRASRTASSARTSSTPTTPPGKWEQAEGPAFPASADAAVERIWVDRAGRRRRRAVVRRRARRAVPQRRWRQELGAGARAMGRAGAAALESRRRRNVPQLDLPLARRCQAPGRRHLAGGRLAHRRRRQQLAAGRQGPGAALPAR